MKLDYETLQFERQLKRAKRLSLLDYAANERRRKQESKVPTTVLRNKPLPSSLASTDEVIVSRNKKVVNRPQQANRNVSDAVKKLKHSAARRIAGRRRLCPTSRRQKGITSRSLKKQKQLPHSNAESHPFLNLEDCSQLALVDLEAKMEIIATSSHGNSNSLSADCMSSETRMNISVRETKLPQPSFRRIDNYIAPPTLGPRLDGFYRYIEKTPEELDDEVEYDMDEEDFAWLKLLNEERRRMGKQTKFPPLSPDTFERLMDRFEKEAHQVGQVSLGRGKLVNTLAGTSVTVPDDDDAVCNICGDDECTNTNAILFCDSCNLAVHQECYGVPYVPEGQWLCRRCQAGVSADVPCCLCPVRGGAVKRTNDRRWAHVVCALWIPEVGFGSIELLEPITKLDHLPPARRKLTCAVCSKSSVGACVQCMRKHCYKAFHITCAQQVGLYMKIEPVFDASGMMVNVSKTLLCDAHKPEGARPFQPMIDNSVDDDGRPPAPERVKTRPPPQCRVQSNNRGRKGVRATNSEEAEGRSGTPVRDVPVIPPKRLACIAESLSMHDKMHVIVKLQAYWTLKRRARNGVPLLRRLQVGSVPATAASTSEESADGSGVLTDVMCVRRLRQQMEKVRLLLELIRKRERSKRELMKAHECMLKLELEPYAVHLRSIIDELQSHDTNGIFALPVPVKEAADYAIRIKRPMDFSTMNMKVDKHAYKSFDEFENDFWLIVNNCKAYNEDGSLYYNLAVNLGTQGKIILDSARQSVYAAGYCPWTGLLLPAEQLEAKSAFAVPSKIQSRRCSEHVGKMRQGGVREFQRRHSIADVPENKSNTIMHCAVNGEINKKKTCVKPARTKTRWRRSVAEDEVSSLVSLTSSVGDSIRTRKQSESEMNVKIEIEKVIETCTKTNEPKPGVAAQVVRKRKKRRKSAYPFPEKVKRVKRPGTDVRGVASKQEAQLQQEAQEPDKKQILHHDSLRAVSRDFHAGPGGLSVGLDDLSTGPRDHPVLPDVSFSPMPEPSDSPSKMTTIAEIQCRRRTRLAQHILHEGDSNGSQFISLERPARKRRRVNRRSSRTNDEDEPPQLSRCPSPMEDSLLPRREMEQTKNNDDANISNNPPALVLSQSHERQVSLISIEESVISPRVDNSDFTEDEVNDHKSITQTLPTTIDPHDKDMKDCKKRDEKTAPISVLKTQTEHSSTGANSEASVGEVCPLDANGVVLHEDTLDSVVSTESQTCSRTVAAERGGLFDRFLALTTVVDCDSSYGSTYGRGGAVTSDSDTTSSSSPDRAGMSGLDSDGVSGSPTHRVNPGVDSESVDVKTSLDLENSSCRSSFDSNDLEKNNKAKELQKDCV